jgi:hypothetical protein
MPMRVLDPTFEDAAMTAAGPRRLASLAGRTVGLLDNGKIRVHKLLDYVEEMLRSQHGVAQILRAKKPDASRPAPPEVMADLRRCEVVISGVGD